MKLMDLDYGKRSLIKDNLSEEVEISPSVVILTYTTFQCIARDPHNEILVWFFNNDRRRKYGVEKENLFNRFDKYHNIVDIINDLIFCLILEIIIVDNKEFVAISPISNIYQLDLDKIKKIKEEFDDVKYDGIYQFNVNKARYILGNKNRFFKFMKKTINS